jgi:hypothetical protein
MRTPELDEQDPVVYRSRRRQLLIMGGMVALFVLLWAQTQQPDYETHVKPAFGRYVWELAPFLGLTIVMAVRAFRVRIVTTALALHLYRVLGHERLPWSEVVGFEVHPSPSGKLLTVKARLTDRRTVKITSFRVRRRREDPAPEAEALAVQLRADQRARAEGLVPTLPVAAPFRAEVVGGR